MKKSVNIIIGIQLISISSVVLFGTIPPGIIQRYAPMVQLSSYEKHFPSSIEWFIARSSLKGPGVNIPQGSVTIEQLARYTSSDYYLQPVNSATFKGFSVTGGTKNGEIKKGTINAPCYAHVIEKPQNRGFVIQYMFFYPYNGPTVGMPANIGAHQGDWEHIDVHLKRSASDGKDAIDQIYYARHKASQYGEYYKPNQVKFVEGTHPIVYAAQYGHASYVKSFKGVNTVLDWTNEDGPQWRCWKNVVDVGSKAQPTKGQEWILFGGSWGKGGPRTPSYQNWWREPDKDRLPLLTITATPGPMPGEKARSSKNFDLKGKVPTFIKKLYWWIEHPKASTITFRIHQDRILGDKKNIYNPITASGSTTIAGDNTNLYISTITSTEDLKGTGDLKIHIEGVFE